MPVRFQCNNASDFTLGGGGLRGPNTLPRRTDPELAHERPASAPDRSDLGLMPRVLGTRGQMNLEICVDSVESAVAAEGPAEPQR